MVVPEIVTAGLEDFVPIIIFVVVIGRIVNAIKKAASGAKTPTGGKPSGERKLEKDLELTVAFHDPCYLGRFNDQYDSPRDLIRKARAGKGALVEMDYSRESSFCCGAGGGNMWYEMDDEKDRMNLARVRQAAATGANTVATACSFCMIMMDDGVKVEGKEDSLEVKDVAELIADSL